MNHGFSRTLAFGLVTAFLCCAAQAEDLVVGIFGGSFADNSKICHIAPFEKKTGAKVTLKLGNSSQFAAAVRATGGKSDFDVVYIDNSLAAQLKNEKLLETLDKSKLSNAPDISPKAFDKDNQYVAFETSATLIVYDPTQIKTPPTSWNDLYKPEYAGKLAIGDISGTSGAQLLIALNRMKGGTLTNMDPGFEAIKPLAKASVTLYTQADQLVSMFERKEIAIAVWYPDRAGAAMDKGLPLAVAYPKEGAVGILPALVIPKGAKSPELALKYIDEVLSRDGQACFAEKSYAGPVNTKATVSDKAAKIVPYRETFDKLYLPEPEAVAKGLPEWSKRWQREVAR
ncbi:MULTISPECIES: ABC transporter substrate-binding protein [unclassified Variovorax]|uniref:ABC transporter substrate-binding protein n=1 Tax=unclassified Variovorax TaxID=663243 RepID=UPI0013169D04|nr:MULTISPECIES: ABC transporter substrate-binding protein [unclassified Variovorax]VTU45678.1 Spermidine/putrescine-binding periplasmic protein precursor [Variovorax sp. PBL-E5]VTU46587.1 Spermidine/putrescine-binding periplasmic protein precursor [Variovorax sp. SRS16]